MDASVAVAGGGLAGLVAARHLADRGAEVTLFEREDRLGGRVGSIRRDGYVLDRGFQVFLTAYPAARQELDYDALELRSFTPGAVICRDGGRHVVSDPLRDPKAAFETALTRELTVGDKLRVLALRRDLADASDEEIFSGEDATTAAYLHERGFSRRFIERFAAPFYGGVTLDRSLSTSRRVFEYTFKMFATGEAAVPAAGMAAIPEQLADRARAAGAALETGTPVTDLSVGDGVTVTTAGETVTVDAAVVATDPPAASELTGVETVPAGGRGCVTQYYRLPADYDLRTGGRILLNADGERPNHLVDVSAVAPEHAADDRTLLSATFLDSGGDSLADTAPRAFADATADALADWYPALDSDSLDVVETVRVPFAQFPQPPGFQADLPGVGAPDGPVYLAGDYTELASINAAVAGGRRAANALLADLQQRS